MTAHEALSLALADALDAGLRIACAEGDGWLSEDATQRAEAARRCDGCPCLTECAAAAESTKERWGVWAGVDRSPRATSKKLPTQTSKETKK